MKKNKMMRTAAGLLVATLLTTSVISGTFAKYTTTNSGSDSARVAKFGVEITANGETFAKEYDTNDSLVSGTIAKSVIGTGTSENDKKVVAPGTKGTMVSMTLTGTPEVAVKVSYAGAFSLNDNWIVNTNEFYCPLVIKVKSSSGTTEIKQDGSTVTDKTSFEQAVNNAIAAYSKEYAANTNLSTKGDESLTVEWEWPFSDENGTNDAKDTALGNAAATSTAATVTLSVTTTVTQID